MQKHTLLSISFLLLSILLNSDVSCTNVDSLEKALKDCSEIEKFKIYKDLAIGLKESQIDSAQFFAEKGLMLAKKLKQGEQIGEFYDLRGHILEQKGEINDAIENFTNAYNTFSEINSFDKAVRSLSNLGAMLIENGRYSDAGFHLFNALKIAEERNLTEIKGSILTNIGLLFFNQEEWDKSIDYYTKSIPIKIKVKDFAGLALLYNNIGIAYFYKDMPDSVLVNFQRSLDLYIKIGDKLGQTRPLFNIGEVYYSKGDYNKAMEFYNKSITLEREIGYKKGVAASLIYIGTLYADRKDFINALKNQYEGMALTKEVDSKSILLDAYQSIFETYKKMDISDSALHYHILYSQLKDSLFNLEKSKQISELETVYETQKKEQQIALQKAEMKRKSNYNITLIIILALTFGLVILVYRVYYQKRNANTILEEKNRQLAEQNRQITNSITYASFIQSAILPPLNLFNEFFPEHFILFKPKDIVSGDFYWLTKKDGHLFVAVADCTGHGVPGAFMSMLGMTFLNEIINIYGETKPQKILDIMRGKIISALHQTDSPTDSRDGMDIALCSFDQKQGILEYIGAYSPLIIYSGGEIIEIVPDKMPIGYHKTRTNDFQLKTLHLKKGDTIYLFTDGYSDQFGGPDGKKYTRKKFYNFLNTIVNLPVSDQKQRLNYEFIEWMGYSEQIDDVTVVGIKVN